LQAYHQRYSLLSAGSRYRTQQRAVKAKLVSSAFCILDGSRRGYSPDKYRALPPLSEGHEYAPTLRSRLIPKISHMFAQLFNIGRHQSAGNAQPD
jgi:hypothetical protein